MRRLFFFICVLVTFFSACNSNTKVGLSFDCDSFEQQTLNRNEAEMLVPDSVLLGRPSTIRHHPDGFLMIHDQTTEHQVIITDLKDRSTHGLVTRGRGPKEILLAWDAEIYNGDVWVSGPRESKVVRLALKQDTRKFDVAEDFFLPEIQFMRALPYTDSEFLIMSRGSSGKRMEIVSHKGEIIREVGSFPDVKADGDGKPNNAWLQSVITISPDRRHTAVSYMSMDCIDIYDGNMELKKRLRGPIGADPKFVIQKIAGGIRFLQEPLFMVYEETASNNDMFFVRYNGIEIKSDADLDKEAYRIFSFDWDGKPLKCYTFDHPVWCFDVDAEGKKMYVATRNNESLEPEILIYNL